MAPDRPQSRSRDTQPTDEVQRAVRPAQEPTAAVDALGLEPFQSPEQAPPPRGRDSDESRAARLLGMQQRLGNQAAQRYVQRAVAPSEEETEADAGGHLPASPGRGSPLNDGAQRQLDQGLGADLSGMRVHTDTAADQMARDIHAVAFTTGSDVFFRSGAYEPGTPNGMRLLAHEAAHVVQQQQGVSLRGGIGAAGDVYEQQADAVAGRVLADQPAADVLGAGSRGGGSAVGAVQREGENEAKSPNGTVAPAAAPAAAAPAAASPVPAATGAPTTPAGAKTATITLSAIYENVPGEAKDKVKRATSDDTLWLDPLTMLSNHPSQLQKTKAFGVVAGGGQTVVDSYAAPVSDTDRPAGTGSISAELKYAGNMKKSFNVEVTGIPPGKEHDDAVKAARKVIEGDVATYGDVDEVTKHAQTAVSEAHPDAKVVVTTNKDKVMDAGQSTFYYKVHAKGAGIQMTVLTAPVGEKQVTYGGSTTKGSTAEDDKSKTDKSSNEKVDTTKNAHDTEKKDSTSTETVEVQYNKAVARTLEDYVSKATTTHDEVASDLAEKTVKDADYHEKEHEESSRKASNVTDYTKNVESGTKDKENWAAKLKKVIGVVKSVTEIPFIGKTKLGKWFNRGFKGWWMDLAEIGLDQFAETGKVKYEDTTVHEDQQIKDDKTGDKNKDIKLHDETETKRKLTEDFKSKTKEDWDRHLKDVTTTAETYKSSTTKVASSTTDTTHAESGSAATSKSEHEEVEKHKTTQNQTATSTFQATQTWKYTAPVIKAAVVDGDAEVSAVPLTVSPEDEGAAKPTKV